MLRYVFEPSSHAEFDWEKWATLRGRKMYVFNFKVNQAFSRYLIKDGESHLDVIAGYHGLVYADSETKSVMRIVVQCDSIPPELPDPASVPGSELRHGQDRRPGVSAATQFRTSFS